jgi:hypothetical protein
VMEEELSLHCGSHLLLHCCNRAKGAVVSQRWLSQCSAYLASSGRAGSAQAMQEHILDLFLTADLYHCCDPSDLLPGDNELRRSSRDAPVL